MDSSFFHNAKDAKECCHEGVEDTIETSELLSLLNELEFKVSENRRKTNMLNNLMRNPEPLETDRANNESDNLFIRLRYIVCLVEDSNDSLDKLLKDLKIIEGVKIL